MAAPTTPERNSRIEWLLEQLIAKVEDSGAPGTVMKYGGRVDTVDELPATGLPNQYYFVGPVTSANFDEYVWAEPEGGTGHWDLLGAVTITVDLVLDITSNNPIANSAVTAALNDKQNTLTFDSVPTSGSTNPVTSGGVSEALGNKADTAGLSRVATSGSYNDLSDKPNIPDTSELYPKSWDIELSKEEYNALGPEKTYDGKNYYVYDENEPTEEVFIYGFHVDPSESDPSQAVTYLADAVGKTPAAMGASTFGYGDWKNAFFMPKPCMLGFDGNVEYYLDPDDYSKKADGTASDIATSTTANAMMEWPLIWYKFEAGTAEGEGYFYVSNKKVDSTYHCWCNYDANDNVIEHFYTAIYNGTGTDKLRSLSGVALTSANGNGGTTGQQEVDRAIANNTTQTVEWYTDVLSDRLLISALMILMSKSLDDQAAFGRGLDTGGQTAKEAYVTGSLNDKGLFWGDTSAGSSGVKIFGMENWYGCCWHRTAGMVGTSSGYRIKLTYGTVDGSTASGYSSAGAGYLAVSGRPATNDYVSKMQFNDKGFFPKVVGGSSSTYWAEYFYAGNGYALFGGNSYGGLNVGSSCVHLYYGFGNSNGGISASLSCKPKRSSN